MNQNYQMQPVASGLAGLGRGGDSMLVHMQPREVAGLQSLAMAHGGSLTINPHTGLPEAGFLGDILGVVAPIALGAALGPAGLVGAEGLFGMGSLGAGLATGALGWALTGDPLKGLMAGLGGYSGANFGSSVANAGITKGLSAAPEGILSSAEKVAESAIVPEAATATSASSAIPGSSEFWNATKVPVGPTPPAPVPFGDQLGDIALPKTATANSPIEAQWGVSQTKPSFSQGVKNIMADPWKFIKNNPGTTASVALPLLGTKGPATIPEAKKEESNYKGPYKLVRDVSFPTGRDPNDSSEYTYFKNPRILAAGEYAAGGQVDTYNPDNPGAATNLSRDGYGLASFKTQNPDPQPFQIAQQPSPMTYARGGYLDGPGDGMSDSIPATIAGRQPARLADGEFVVPADVVSHLGNGSTKAGAQRLYAMMDKVRKARTGNTKQGRQINPHKFLPA
jgi:hypothetical protein